MPSFSSMILRFRDLSTPADTTTIAEHKRIILEKGYVWWGWWHKQGEIVPENAFREILGEIGKTGHFQVFLFDTGTYKLQSARLIDVKWDNRLTLIATPEKSATPQYYGNSHYLAWFKLDSIDDTILAETVLKHWAYVRMAHESPHFERLENA